ncbi:MAG TPA: MMPL family transporter [Polyangiaceae bacterium]|nr:MMPL family transporter [Polyangiaceae bacterium]
MKGGDVPRRRLAQVLSRLSRLVELPERRPAVMLVIGTVVLAVALAMASKLRVVAGLEDLLPRGRASVVELERVRERVPAVSSLTIVLEGAEPGVVKEAERDITTAVSAMGLPWVGSVESGMGDAVAFLEPRAGLYVASDKLESLAADLERRVDWEVQRTAGLLLDERTEEPPPITAENVRKRLGLATSTAPHPRATYGSTDGRTAVLVVHTAVLNSDFAASQEAVRRVRAAVETLHLERRSGSLRFGLSGGLVSAARAQATIEADLVNVGAIGTLAILGVVFLYYLRLRMVACLVVAVAVGVAITFGAARPLVGELNTATGFLMTIVAGNGINPGIIYLARYLEARRAGVPHPAALSEARRETWLPTLGASGAAALAYGALVVSEFRGFRDFGLLGSFGMVCCWLCTFAFLPPMLTLAESIAPLRASREEARGWLGRATSQGLRFGVPFAWLAARRPRLLAVLGLLLAVVAAATTLRHASGGAMEHELRRVYDSATPDPETLRLAALSEDASADVSVDGMAILVDRTEQVPWLVAALTARRDAAPGDAKPFAAIHTLQDFVPRDQEKTIPLLLEIKEHVLRARARGFVSDTDFVEISRYLPPDDVRPFALADLPASVARPFTERDGTRGRIVYLTPTTPELVHDARYLARWADSFRRTELPDGSVVLGSGRAVVHADIWAAVASDVPKATALALLVTLGVIALVFRRPAAIALVAATLLVGVAWMTGLLSALGVRLNVLNFIALPITFGVGADYAVNVMQRSLRDGPGRALGAVRETGGAVVLCSLTTILGYLALAGSTSAGVRSLGFAAVTGEVTCLLAAMLVLPCVLLWRDGSRTSPGPSPSPAARRDVTAESPP